MSIKIMTAVWDNQTGNLDAYETAYLLKLADYGPQVFPSIPTLAKKTRISPRKIQYLNESLAAKGYLNVIERVRLNGSKTSNAYQLNVNKLLIEAGMEPMDNDETGIPPAHCAPPPAHRAPPPRTPCTPYKQELKQVFKQEKENKQKKNDRTLAQPKAADVVLSIFKYWQERLNHPRAVLDKKRKRLLEEALKAYTPDQLTLAIDGCASSPWHMGKNERGMIYDSIPLIFRDSDKIESFIRMATIKPKPTQTKAEQTQSLNQAFMELMHEFSAPEGLINGAV